MKTLVQYCKENFEFSSLSNDTLFFKASDGFVCRVPVKELDGSSINAIERGSILMRWIRKELDAIKAL